MTYKGGYKNMLDFLVNELNRYDCKAFVDRDKVYFEKLPGLIVYEHQEDEEKRLICVDYNQGKTVVSYTCFFPLEAVAYILGKEYLLK